MYAMIDSVGLRSYQHRHERALGRQNEGSGENGRTCDIQARRGIINDVKGNSEIVGVGDQCLADFAIKVHAEDHHIFNLIQLI